MARKQHHFCTRAVTAAVTFCLVASVAASSGADVEAGVTGTWKVVDHQLDNGSDYLVYLQLRQSGTQVTGRVVYPWGNVDIRSGVITGNKFAMVQHLWEGMEFRDEGEISGARLVFRGTNFDHQWHSYLGERVSDSEADPPAKLPLPALRDLPDNGLARTPPMGWNSWNRFGTTVSDKTVREIADAMVDSGMRNAGYVYVNIDDGWEGQRDSAGVLHANQKFPDMKKLAVDLHAKGLKLGIYSSPGANTCAGYEGSLGHEQRDAQTFVDWGVDYLKYDVCGATKIYRDDETRALYQKMGEALLKAGRPIVYSLSASETTYLWGAQAGGNLWRTTGDISPSWKVVSENGFSQDKLAPYARPGHWNDPDMLEVGNGKMTSEEYRAHMSLWALLAAPLIAGNDLRSMSEETKAILTNREVIAVDQDPLGKQGTRIFKRGDQEAWARPLADGSFAAGLFNRGEAAASMAVKFSDVDARLKGSVRDLWAGRDLAAEGGQVVVTVSAHGVALLRLH